MAVHIMCLSIQGTTKKRFAKIYISQYFYNAQRFSKIEIAQFHCIYINLKIFLCKQAKSYSNAKLSTNERSCLWGFSALLLAFSKDIFKLEYLHV
ncbi:hypothetical protein T02_13820 [Trichinella nativa]|uniref:Uncharacterized protein n=1 Tax=Trichinella nativa TaxID=6335 RepID=A0A0V1LVF8_9BILA|nr:hypothetical protein T02_13820 [Trichinella nativa]